MIRPVPPQATRGSKESSVFPGHLLENSAHVVVESLEDPLVDELLA